MLDLARVIFEEQSTLHDVVYKIMMNTQSLLQCERCSVLLVDPTSKVIVITLKLETIQDETFWQSPPPREYKEYQDQSFGSLFFHVKLSMLIMKILKIDLKINYS